MAKPSLENINITNTFQVWLDRTNEIVDILKSESITASILGDTTGSVGVPMKARLYGEFRSNDIIIDDKLYTDDIYPNVGNSEVNIRGSVIAESSSIYSGIFKSAGGARTKYSSSSLDWITGFENDSNNNFIIDTGVGARKFTLTPFGNLIIPGSFTASGGFTGNVIGTVSSLANHTTSNLAEGSNLYYTTSRARNAISGGTGVTYNSSTGRVSIGQEVNTNSNVRFNKIDVTTDVLVDRHLFAGGNLDITGIGIIRSNFKVNGTAEIVDNIYARKSLFVDNTAYIEQNLYAKKDLFVNHNIIVDNQIIGKQGLSSSPGYAFANDTNTGMWSTDPNTDNVTIRFSLNGSEKLKIYQGGIYTPRKITANDGFRALDGDIKAENGNIYARKSLFVDNTAYIENHLYARKDLYVTQSLRVYDQFVGKQGSSSSPGYTFANDTNTGMWSTDPNTDDVTIRFSLNGAERLKIYKNGIYTPRKITANDGFRASDGDIKADSGNIIASGNVTAYSDISLKKNIKDIDLFRIRKAFSELRGTTYENKKDGITNIGVIAQEWEKLFPELVHKDEDGIKSFAYGNAIAVLLEMIKFLNSKFENYREEQLHDN